MAVEDVRNKLLTPDNVESAAATREAAIKTVSAEIWNAQDKTRGEEGVQWSDFGRTYTPESKRKREARKKQLIGGGIAAAALATVAIAAPIVESFDTPSSILSAQDKSHSASDPNADRKGQLPDPKDGAEPYGGAVIVEAPGVLRDAKEAAEKEVSEAGRTAANNILDYLAADASMTVPYEAGVFGGTDYDAFGNKAYNLAQDNPELRVPEAFVKIADAPNKITISVVDGTDSTDGWSLTGSVSQTVTISDARSKDLQGKLSSGEPLTLDDFREAVNDPESKLSTTASTDSGSARGRWSGDVENAATSQEVAEQKNGFTDELNKAMGALDLERYTK